MSISKLLTPLLALLLAPLLLGVVNRTKAVVGGRTGAPLLQSYWDLAKLLRKGAVYSSTTTWVFRAGPIVALATALVATCLVPLGGAPAPVSFVGDFLAFSSLLALARFATVAAALDTGSAFEGMGASREVTFGALAEPILLVALGAVARETDALSLSAMLVPSYGHWNPAQQPTFALVAAALVVVVLAENCRIPFDDPNTHLELTMIHEVMVLDHGGPDLAFILYASALKLWLLGSLLVGVLVPDLGDPWLNLLAALAGLLTLGVVIGLVESTMARLRLLRVPQLLVGAGALSVMGLIVALR
jgi:formate hydrogenlyase subunit 4